MRTIDTIASGFRTIVKRPWLALIPMALDLFLWLGPQVTIAPIVDDAVASARAAISANPGAFGGSAGVFDIDTIADLLSETVGRTNILSLAAWQRLGIPTLAAGVPVSNGAGRIVRLADPGTALGLQLVALAIGLLFAAFFLVLLARETRGDTLPLTGLIGAALTAWWRLAMVFVPLAAVMALALVVGMLLGPLLIVVGFGLVWLSLFLSFVPQAISLADAGPLAAVSSSFRVVRSYLWPSLGILLLTSLLSNGLGLLFRRFYVVSDVARVLSIAANALVGTALTLSLFAFYRDRLAALHQLLERRRPPA